VSEQTPTNDERLEQQRPRRGTASQDAITAKQESAREPRQPPLCGGTQANRRSAFVYAAGPWRFGRSPPAQAHAQPEIHVLAICEQTLVKATDLLER
jgi:hypothetical protein